VKHFLDFASTREEKAASEWKLKSAREKLQEAIEIIDELRTKFLSSEYGVENTQSSCLTLPGSLYESNRENAALSSKCKDLTEEISEGKSGVSRALEEMDESCGQRDAMSHELEHSNSMDREE
jgi:chromosome segregation ATPase